MKDMCFSHDDPPRVLPQPTVGGLIASPTSAESEAEGFKTTPAFKEIQIAMKEVSTNAVSYSVVDAGTLRGVYFIFRFK